MFATAAGSTVLGGICSKPSFPQPLSRAFKQGPGKGLWLGCRARLLTQGEQYGDAGRWCSAGIHQKLILTFHSWSAPWRKETGYIKMLDRPPCSDILRLKYKFVCEYPLRKCHQSLAGCRGSCSEWHANMWVVCLLPAWRIDRLVWLPPSLCAQHMCTLQAHDNHPKVSRELGRAVCSRTMW